MAFFDDLGRTITDMGKDAAQKTRDVVDVLQMKAQISSEKSKLRDLYAEMGKDFYESHTQEAQDEYSDTCGRLQTTLDKIAELEEKISRLDNTITCPSCGAVIDKEAVFCSKCGTAVTSAESEASPETTETEVEVSEDVDGSAAVVVEDDMFVESDTVSVEKEEGGSVEEDDGKEEA